MRYAVLAAAALCSMPVLGQAADKRDWHIGCEASDKCSYFEDNSVDHGHLARREHVPDWEYFDTRCKPDAHDNTIERFNGTHWVDYYACPFLGSCADLRGRGSCGQGSNVWVVPGKYLLTTYKCDGNGARGKCVETGETKPLGSSSTTRKGDSVLVPLRSGDKQTKRTFEAPTRCAPESLSEIQFFDEVAHAWQNFHTCGTFGTDEVCRNVHGRGTCFDGSSTSTPVMILNGPLDDGPSTPRKRGYSLPLRCDPNSDSWIQYYDDEHRTWTNIHECRGHEWCRDKDGKVSCEDVRGPEKPSANSAGDNDPSSGASDDSDEFLMTGIKEDMVSGEFQTRCDPADTKSKLVQYLDAGNWNWFYVCRGTCIQLPEFAACREQEDKYLIPAPTVPARALHAHHTFDTRRNPKSSSEVQRFHGQHWLPFHTRDIIGSCKDIDDHGYCYRPVPSYLGTKCNKDNESEVLEWNGRSWGFSGVCLPPYVCGETGLGIKFAICKDPSGDGKGIWLPWPYLASNSSSGVVTQCMGPEELYQFNGKNWVPYRHCDEGFSCELMTNTLGAKNAGCVAEAFDAVKDAQAARAHRPLAVVEDPDHYEPFGFDHRAKLPKHSDPGLIEDTEKLLFQGEGLIQEGHDLVDHGDALYESLYGPGSGPARSPQDAAPRDNYPPKHESAFKHGSTSSLPQRSEQGLIDDSVSMRQQGQRLVLEGVALVEQGRQLLHAIFGDKADEVVNRMTNSKATEATAASISKETGAILKSRGDDLRDASCRHACDCGAFPSEQCDKQCRKCILFEFDVTATSGGRPMRGSCGEECKCDVLDLKCWVECADCHDDRAISHSEPSDVPSRHPGQ